MIDETDLRIIEILQQNVTATNKSIGLEIGLSDVAVGNRINRLLDEKIIRSTIFYDTDDAGLHNYCILEIKVRGRDIDSVARDLATVEEFQVVARIVGAADISVHFFARDLAHMELLRKKAVGIDGIHTIDAHISARPVKFMNSFGTYAMLKREHSDG